MYLLERGELHLDIPFIHLLLLVCNSFSLDFLLSGSLFIVCWLRIILLPFFFFVVGGRIDGWDNLLFSLYMHGFGDIRLDACDCDYACDFDCDDVEDHI